MRYHGLPSSAVDSRQGMHRRCRRNMPSVFHFLSSIQTSPHTTAAGKSRRCRDADATGLFWLWLSPHRIAAPAPRRSRAVSRAARAACSDAQFLGYTTLPGRQIINNIMMMPSKHAGVPPSQALYHSSISRSRKEELRRQKQNYERTADAEDAIFSMA